MREGRARDEHGTSTGRAGLGGAGGLGWCAPVGLGECGVAGDVHNPVSPGTQSQDTSSCKATRVVC